MQLPEGLVDRMGLTMPPAPEGLKVPSLPTCKDSGQPLPREQMVLGLRAAKVGLFVSSECLLPLLSGVSG